jgi:hypothetical protein
MKNHSKMPPKGRKTKKEKSALYSQQWAKFVLPQHTKNIATFNAEQLRSFTKVADGVYRWPEIKFTPSPAMPLPGPREAERLFAVYCPPAKDTDVVAASALAERSLATLCRLARAGDGEALWQLATIVKEAVGGLNQIVESNPDSIKPLARKCSHWPMLRSTAPLLCADDSLLEKIELGKAAGVQLDEISRWKPDYAANIAAELVKHLEYIRKENPTVLADGKKAEYSKLLPAFKKDTAPRWWQQAEQFLLATYPRPEEIAELDALVTAKSKRKFPSRRRVVILEKIKARFMGMAI